MSKIIAAKQWVKVYYEEGQKYRITVRAQLIHHEGNKKPHFSIGGDIERLAKNGRKVWESGGCIHEEVLRHFPHLKPLVDIHLSDDDGVPMHAYSNAGYWAGFTKYQARNVPQLANHLRVTIEEAENLIQFIENFYGEFDSITTYERAWEHTCDDEGLTEKWKKEANEALAILTPVFQEVTR